MMVKYKADGKSRDKAEQSNGAMRKSIEKGQKKRTKH